MSRSITSYPEHVREAVVRRRLREQAGGLGYLAALAAKAHIDREARYAKADAEIRDAA